jgi:XTP/dITP diphosphohydrolase
LRETFILDELLIASRNRGKVTEIREILSLENVDILDLHELGFEGEIEESGDTFEENALIKARAVFRRYNRPVVADDSGLVVPFLDGEPGVRSARYAGPDATDRENNDLLLSRLRDANGKEREAFFHCVAVFYTGPGGYQTAEGTVHGIIARELHGTGGFGYDPLFHVVQHGRTLAQLDNAQKNAISHRGMAFRTLKRHVSAYLAEHDVVE